MARKKHIFMNSEDAYSVTTLAKSVVLKIARQYRNWSRGLEECAGIDETIHNICSLWYSLRVFTTATSIRLSTHSWVFHYCISYVPHHIYLITMVITSTTLENSTCIPFSNCYDNIFKKSRSDMNTERWKIFLMVRVTVLQRTSSTLHEGYTANADK